MTNDQETIFGQVSEARLSHQETVQLTELLPVEQSRIKDNPDYRDQETTDGLRALRSFTRGQQQQDFVVQREFDCFRKVERSTVERTMTEDEGLKKRKHSNSGKTRVTTRSLTLEKDGRRGKDKILAAAKKKSHDDGRWNNGKAERKIGAKIAERLIDVEDEVYHYLQQQPDICESATDDDDDDDDDDVEDVVDDDVEDVEDESTAIPTSDTTTTTRLEILSAGVYRDMANNFSTGSSGTKETWNESSGRIGRNKKGEKTKIRNNGSNEDKSRKEKEDKDLKTIRDNYALERENNNQAERNGDTREGDGSSDASTKKDGTKAARCEKEEKKKYCCVTCNSSFKGSGGLRNHYKVVHAAGPIYKCDDCGKEFPLKERLKLHVRTHTGFKPYKCPVCSMSFARGGQLVQHRGTHSQIKPYRCNMCSGTFTCAANLALHVKRHNGQKDHKCEICGRAFVRKDALKKHLECLHRDVKSFLCVICNKTFKGHLPQHMRTHAQDRPHGCATCGQRFAQKSQLTVHQRTHSGQRPFRCLVCWQAFAHSTALKLHTRRHTGERPFKCAECNAGFTQLPHWKKHMKCIHGRSEPYCCKNCNSFFRIKNDLENHEKSCDVATDYTSGASADSPKFRSGNVERMRLLLAVLLKRISKPERLDELGFGKRLIDEVLQDSLVSAGKVPSRIGELDELESLRKNLETFLEWTVPKEHWDKLRKTKKTPEEILETLTAT